MPSTVDPADSMETAREDYQDAVGHHARAAVPPRFARTWLVLLIAVVLIACLVGAFFLGAKHTPSGPSAAEQAAATVPVWASVQNRQVSDAVQAAGTVKPGATAAMSGGDGGVLVRQVLEPGQQIGPGTLLGLVNGVPYFAMEGPLLLYRDLKEKDKGDDVSALQTSLAAAGYATAVDGVVDASTLEAVTQLYRSEGLDVPEKGITQIQHTVFVPLPQGQRNVVDAAKVGQSIGADTPIVTVRVSAASVEFRAEVDQAGQLPAGTGLKITSSKGTSAGAVEKMGAFQAGEGAQKPGYLISARVDDPGILLEGQSVSVSSQGSPQSVLSVPLTAVRQDASGSYVQVKDGEDTKDDQGRVAPVTRRASVTVLRSAGGYAAVEGGVAAGDQVLVQ